MMRVGRGSVWGCNGPHEEAARALQAQIQEEEEKGPRLKAAWGEPAAKLEKAAVVTKRIPVFPNRSRRYAGGAKQKPDGWICAHAVPQDCRTEDDIILCKACAAAVEAGAEIVQCEAPRRTGERASTALLAD